jgi:hypothetical protein
MQSSMISPDRLLEIEVLGFSTAEIDLIFETAAEAKTALPSPEDSIPAV